MSKTKKIEIEVPEGKEAKWVNGVLTLIDEKPKDVTERIKTFTDAVEELGEDDELVKEYRALNAIDGVRLDTLNWLRLGIIVRALNEGWTPKFKGEYRYYPYFYLYTKDEIFKMSEEKKSRVVLRSGNSASGNGGVACVDAYNGASYDFDPYGSRLALKSEELALYAGRQFTEEYAELILNENVERRYTE